MASRTYADRHTHASCNAVTLVWGSPRLAPINYQIGIGYQPSYYFFVVLATKFSNLVQKKKIRPVRGQSD